MRAQGIELLVPGYPLRVVDADVAVLPPPGEPEYNVYTPLLREMGIPVVAERDPLRGLVLALKYPVRSVSRLLFGVDPGGECGVTTIGDGTVIYTFKSPCRSAGARILEVSRRIPHDKMNVYVGDGQGLGEAMHSLVAAGISYSIIEERGSTVEPSHGPLRGVLKDKDLLASLTIALRGAYAWAYYSKELPRADGLRGPQG